MKETILEIEIDSPPIEIALDVDDGKVSLIFDELDTTNEVLEEISIEIGPSETEEDLNDIIEEETEHAIDSDDLKHINSMNTAIHFIIHRFQRCLTAFSTVCFVNV